MKTKFSFLANLAVVAIAAFMVGCGTAESASPVGHKTDALDASAWDSAKWISAANAPVLTDRKNDRAADGASWFVSTVKNEQAVTSAKWMTTS